MPKNDQIELQFLIDAIRSDLLKNRKIRKNLSQNKNHDAIDRETQITIDALIGEYRAVTKFYHQLKKIVNG